MSENYKEEVVTGSSFIRCTQVTISNPLNQIPMVQFYKEKVTVFGNGKSLTENLGVVQIPFNPDKVIEILDKNTMTKTGSSFLMGDLYPLLFSAAVQAFEENK